MANLFSSSSVTVAVVLIFFSLPGCTSTETTISDTLPYEAQQRINTSEEFNVDFTFKGHPDAETITASFGGAKSSYSINGPFKGKLEQLFRAKFGEISEDSENKVKVQVSDINPKSETGPPIHRLSMSVDVTVMHEGKENSRNFSFRTTVRPKDETDMTISYRIPPEPIEDYLMQYVVGIDSFLDSTLGIQ
jgi:uncharacterized lipoprotein YajG